MMALVTIANEHLKVAVSSVGAEIQSIVDEKGRERMWQGDPAFWTGRAPILFPVAGGFRDDHYELDGIRYDMPKHGFVRRAEWQLEKETDTCAAFLMQEKHPGFPFDYDLRAIYTLEGKALQVSYQVCSRDERPFYFSVGCHEAYAVPEGIEAYEIVFDEEEQLASYILQGNCNLHDTLMIHEKTNVMPLKTEYFAVDALVFRNLKSKGVVLQGGSEGRKIRVDFPDHPVLMFWQKPGASYICIEAWCNGPDFIDAPADIAKKPGFMRLEKGHKITRTHTITFIE